MNHTNECRDRMEGLMANTGDERVDIFAKGIADEMEEQATREAKRKGEALQAKPNDETETRKPEEGGSRGEGRRGIEGGTCRD